MRPGNGEDFEAMAREYSEGPNAKGGGGLGLIRRGEMMKEVDETIFALEPGSISDIVETPIGYHIFKVIAKLPATSKDFDSAKADITEEIYRKDWGASMPDECPPVPAQS